MSWLYREFGASILTSLTLLFAYRCTENRRTAMLLLDAKLRDGQNRVAYKELEPTS